MPARSHRHRHHLVRPRLRPGQPLLVLRIEGERLVQHAPQEVRDAREAAVHLPQGHNEVVARDETVKGYEFAKDQYVVFSPEELKALEEKATSTIDIQEFVPLDKVDREYLDKVYYLGPDKGGDRAYRLLAAALEETGKAAARPVRGARAAAPRAPAPAQRRARDGAAALRRRAAPDHRSPRARGRRQADGAHPRQAAHRADGERGLRAREVQGHRARARARGDPEEGRRPGDHRRSRRSRRRAARSSTSWKR